MTIFAYINMKKEMRIKVVFRDCYEKYLQSYIDFMMSVCFITKQSFNAKTDLLLNHFLDMGI